MPALMPANGPSKRGAEAGTRVPLSNAALPVKERRSKPLSFLPSLGSERHGSHSFTAG